MVKALRFFLIFFLFFYLQSSCFIFLVGVPGQFNDIIDTALRLGSPPVAILDLIVEKVKNKELKGPPPTLQQVQAKAKVHANQARTLRGLACISTHYLLHLRTRIVAAFALTEKGAGGHGVDGGHTRVAGELSAEEGLRGASGIHLVAYSL